MKIIKNYENAFKELLAYVAGGKSISIEERRILRRYALASIRMLDGVVLNACDGSTQYSEPYFKEEYPIDDAVATEIHQDDKIVAKTRQDTLVI